LETTYKKNGKQHNNKTDYSLQTYGEKKFQKTTKEMTSNHNKPHSLIPDRKKKMMTDNKIKVSKLSPAMSCFIIDQKEA
jgi:hypothetical protein